MAFVWGVVWQGPPQAISSPRCFYSQFSGVAGVGWEWSERIALQGVFPPLVCCVLQGVSLSPEHNCRSGKGKNTAENEERGKKNVIKRFQNINNSV